ncbi:CalY family protein [Gracilibacillus massiliensis]|uniref:CalY family protein n=1 Tax=Gracilibacillus massiliensis TaxID=1564956 RepID=UPI00071D1B58|nr:CalY family protein [Gracilibacillus massiliensis]
MDIKKKLGISVVTAALGLSLIGGGTFAYFSDSEITNSSFAAGTLDLTAEPTEIINVDNLKPGDQMIRTFELQNSGTLDIAKVLLETDYEVTDVQNDNSEDFGEHIQVEFLMNLDKLDEVVYQTTLADLKSMTPEAVGTSILGPILGEDGLEAGTIDDLSVKFIFVDNGEDQNEFQGDTLELEWTFNAQQTAGEQR